MKYMDQEEEELVESYESNEWNSSDEEKKSFIDAAKNSITKNKRINIRLTTKDFYDIRARAMEEGIPYQTLISSIIHKYNKGALKPGSPKKS